MRRKASVSIAWRVEGESFSAVVDLPFGTTGLFDPPSGPSSVVVVDGQRLEGDAGHSAVLASGPAHGRGDPPRPGLEGGAVAFDGVTPDRARDVRPARASGMNSSSGAGR